MAPANNAVGNLPDREPLRWTAAKAAREHGVTPYLMLKRLKDGGEAPDREGCYATSQIIKVLYGSLHTEGLRKVATEADGVELARDQANAGECRHSDIGGDGVCRRTS